MLDSRALFPAANQLQCIANVQLEMFELLPLTASLSFSKL